MKKHFHTLAGIGGALSVLASTSGAQQNDAPTKNAASPAAKNVARVLAPDAIPRATTPRDLMSDTWIATDALGRTTPMGGKEGVSAPRKGKIAAMFYYIWQQGGIGPIDISKALAANPQNPQLGGVSAFHWWGEPEAGYFRSDDPWVIRRNMSMLSDAGIDVIFFDVTNAFTYLDTVKTLCETLRQMRAEGNATPQIAFLTHARPGFTQTQLYNEFYAKNLYRELWFKWDGKPLIMGVRDAKNDDGSEMSQQIKDFFSWRESWAWSAGKWFGDGRGKWPWLDNLPQKPGLSPDGKVEQIVVETAQHPTGNLGKSYSNKTQPPLDELKLTPDTDKGLYFAEQWQRGLEVDPPLIFITQWNEWIAQRFVVEGESGPGFLGKPTHTGDSFFVDVYNAEFNRDIEPMKGGWSDNYYYQLVGGLRRFKGARPVPPASAPLAIKIDGQFAQWNSVRPEYRDTIGDTLHRDHEGWTKEIRYVNDSGRNDIVSSKVARDAKNFSFYVKTAAPLSPSSEANWMQLFLDTDQNAATGWHGYDFAIFGGDASTRNLLRYEGGKWVVIGKVPFAARGNELELSVPRALLKAPDGNNVSMIFHWTDNASPTDISTWFVNGDSAPNRRFNYAYATPFIPDFGRRTNSPNYIVNPPK